MCHVVYISTDYTHDLSGVHGDRAELEKCGEYDNFDSCQEVLESDNVYFVRDTLSGCSCAFRHLLQFEPNERDFKVDVSKYTFGSPVDEPWMEDDEDDVANTLVLFDLIQEVLSKGFKVDLVDSWEGDNPSLIKTVPVKLSEVSRNAFRLFTYCRFEFS